MGLFSISLGFSPDKNIEDLNQQILEMVEKVKNEGVSQEDVNRVVSKMNTQTILSRDGSGSIALELTETIAGGDWTEYVKGAERLSKVTAADVKRVANSYLLENQSTTGYFIPEEAGGNTSAQPKASGFTMGEETKYYYRNPNVENVEIETNSNKINFEELTSAYESIEPTQKSKKFTRKDVAGIDVVTAKTGAKGFVTVAASLPIASYVGTGKNEMIPDLTVGMLSKGTKLQDKFQFSEKLEKLGANIRINSDVNNVNINFKCLSEDVNTVIELLAEELRQPLFDAKEFELLKEQTINNYKRGLTDPATLGSIALAQALYPKGHPNYKYDVSTTIEKIEAVSLQDLKEFHSTYFGTAGMHLVAVGDVDTKKLYAALKQSFSGWNRGSTAKAVFENPSATVSLEKIVTIPKKPSAELFIGSYTGIERNDKDYVPLYVGTNILGGGFSGRLMQTVRDNEGLTYGIYAKHSGHNQAGGFWTVNASFNPTLFSKGLESTKVQLEKWVNEGVTAEELATSKNSINGRFKVGTATTSGLAQTLLSFLERGLSPDYLDEFPKEIEAVTLEEVNKAITKYIDTDKLVIIKSGSLDQQGQPLE